MDVAETLERPAIEDLALWSLDADKAMDRIADLVEMFCHQGATLRSKDFWARHRAAPRPIL